MVTLSLGRYLLQKTVSKLPPDVGDEDLIQLDLSLLPSELFRPFSPMKTYLLSFPIVR